MEQPNASLQLILSKTAATIARCFKTLSVHYAELGADFGEKIERRATDTKMILDTTLKYGVPVDMLWKPSGASSLQQSAMQITLFPENSANEQKNAGIAQICR